MSPEWVKVRSRNEALDCRVYAMAALYLLKPSWGARAKRLGPGAKKVRKAAPRKKPSVAQLIYDQRKRGALGRSWL